MSDGTKIEWTHRPGTKGETWNPIRAVNKATGGRGHFCVHVSDGCKNCYAEHLQRRFRNPVRYARQDRDKVTLELDEKILMQPLRWRKPRTIFPCSMTDWMLEDHPDEWINKMMAVMALTPQHTYLPLTKRAERMREYMSDTQTPFRIAKAMDIAKESAEQIARVFDVSATQIRNILTGKQWAVEVPIVWPLSNCWKGVSVEDQKHADERIPLLLDTPAVLRWISAEPLLGPVDVKPWLRREEWREESKCNAAGLWDTGVYAYPLPSLNWVVAGGESSQNKQARHMESRWARSLRDQCKAAGVPFFMKQMSDKLPIPEDLMVREWPS